MNNESSFKNDIAILNTIIDKLTSIQAKSKNQFDRNSLQAHNPLALALIDFVERAYSNNYSIRVLLEKATLENFNSVEFSIGLLIRTLLYDGLRLFYLIDGLDKEIDGIDGWKDRKRQKDVLDIINQEQIKYTYGFLKQMSKLNSKAIDYDEMRIDFIKEYNNYFELDVRGNSQFKFPSVRMPNTTDLAKAFFQNKRFKEDSVITTHIWHIYSKYEHYGPVTQFFREYPIALRLQMIILAFQYNAHFTLYTANCLKTIFDFATTKTLVDEMLTDLNALLENVQKRVY